MSDGIIAPGYTPEAVEILCTKRKGNYNVVRIDPDYEPAAVERRDIFGIRFEQGYNALPITRECLQNIVTANKELPEGAVDDLLLALITLKYTQSNSVCYTQDGQTIGVGAGQQSRIHCTRLAGDKADLWHLRRHPKVLGLTFDPALKRAERDNEIDRFIREELTEKREARLPRRRRRRIPGQRRLLPLRRQHRARGPERRQVCSPSRAAASATTTSSKRRTSTAW